MAHRVGGYTRIAAFTLPRRRPRVQPFCEPSRHACVRALNAWAASRQRECLLAGGAAHPTPPGKRFDVAPQMKTTACAVVFAPKKSCYSEELNSLETARMRGSSVTRF